jgi:hypothetical protein
MLDLTTVGTEMMVMMKIEPVDPRQTCRSSRIKQSYYFSSSVSCNIRQDCRVNFMHSQLHNRLHIEKGELARLRVIFFTSEPSVLAPCPRASIFQIRLM